MTAVLSLKNGQFFIQDTTLSGFVPRKLYANTTPSLPVSNTVTETAFSTSYTIPANTLKNGSVLKIRYQGIATATNASDTLAIKLYIGGLAGTLLHSHTATDVADNDVFSGEYEVIVRSIGATGTIVGCGTRKNIPAAEGTAAYADDILASTAIDTTATQLIAVSAQWSAASASDSCRLDFLRIELW